MILLFQPTVGFTFLSLSLSHLSFFSILYLVLTIGVWYGMACCAAFPDDYDD